MNQGSKDDMLGIDAIIKHYESYVTDDNLPPFKNDNHVGAFLYYFSLKINFVFLFLFLSLPIIVSNLNMY